ncbi:MAG: hypothetical protein KIS78_26395 [Labilithrix sp.]|nr:hypothetical protein [Labilithrix sp.]MCW5835958.1 hypothetical protein [Labilithrix sp.]
MRLRLVTPSLGLATVLAWAGCTAFDDAIVRGPDAGVVEPDAGGGGVISDAGCALARVPLTPPPTTLGGTESFVVAARDVALGALPDGGVVPTFGYDLDETCTCPTEPESCELVGEAAKSKHCDGELGRDQAAGRLLAQVYQQTGVDPASYINDGIARGEHGMLIRVDGYNGERNDSDVRVSVYRSIGPDRSGASAVPPTFAADETWSVDRDDLVNEATLESKHQASGFVNDGVLVAELQTSVLPFNADAQINLRDVKITAKVRRSDQGWELDDMIAVGRWPVDDVLNGVAKIQRPDKPTERLCQSAALMLGVRPLVCSATDINDSASRDRKGFPCNALSTALAFRGTPAKIGQVVTPERRDPCAGETIAPCPK